jgi:hypothetical protein
LLHCKNDIAVNPRELQKEPNQDCQTDEDQAYAEEFGGTRHDDSIALVQGSIASIILID